MTIQRIHHVGLAVRDIEQSLGFFHELLGLPITKDAVLEEHGIRGVLLSAGETEIELLEPLTAATAVGRFIEARGEGLHHLCFGSDDVAADLAAAEQRGLPLIDRQPRPGLAGLVAFLHPRASCGVLVEYAQPAPAVPHALTVPANDLSVQAFDHVVVAVRDQDAGVQTFCRNFGLSAGLRSELPELGMRTVALSAGDSVIEIAAPTSDEGRLAASLGQRGDGLYLLSLAVGDITRASAGLERVGIRFEQPATDAAPNRWGLIRPQDANGVLLQFVERHA